MTVDSPTVGRGSAPTANPVELVVAGAAGRMGTRIVALAARVARPAAWSPRSRRPVIRRLGGDAGELAGVQPARRARSAPTPRPPSPASACSSSSPSRRPRLEHLRLVAAAGARAVIGTTGFTRRAARGDRRARPPARAIMLAPNMSVAVTLAFKLLADHGPGARRRLRRRDHRDPSSLQEGRAERHRACAWPRSWPRRWAATWTRRRATAGEGLPGERHAARRSA